ncbi:aminotransferase class V-fold PLP-dependent enzyme [Paenibacillus tarimensis]|uniref:aminotransferase class V-fold PLP-dependent enzyme n=1 Tax=Paenibacillus tarimensis TaxID=416012 RepID=UPI001F29D6F4|nr:aminotransferase class V-fold PLP-dependent enzyme [Paenibacillus tarimensis]MCF2944889.1 aminotransferase class V-fold PLP-dependent enzyme [Paenibacillus tarimensis]
MLMRTSTISPSTVESAVVHQTDWEAIRRQFRLSPDYIHLASSQFIASHPEPVRLAIEAYRNEIDLNPVQYTLANENKRAQRVRDAAADYLGILNPDQIALTDSTTMGLGLLYMGLTLTKDQEIVAPEDDYYSHLEAIRMCARRTGASYRHFKLYNDLNTVTVESLVTTVIETITDKTRVVGLSWVHSNTGIKLPIRRIGEEIAELNKNRDEKTKVIFIVDGVHGFGVETETFDELNCDFLVTGTHKWLYGPRGTGIIAGRDDSWQLIDPVIPTFTEVMDDVIQHKHRPERMDGKQMTPGGFHSLEHRWALTDAFKFVKSIGKEQIKERIHSLNRYCKERLHRMDHVTLHTPISELLSAGIIAFEVDGYSTKQTVAHLLSHRIVCTAAPYFLSYARFTPGIYNTFEEIDEALRVIADMKE